MHECMDSTLDYRKLIIWIRLKAQKVSTSFIKEYLMSFGKAELFWFSQ